MKYVTATVHSKFVVNLISCSQLFKLVFVRYLPSRVFITSFDLPLILPSSPLSLSSDSKICRTDPDHVNHAGQFATGFSIITAYIVSQPKTFYY